MEADDSGVGHVPPCRGGGHVLPGAVRDAFRDHEQRRI